MNKYRALHLSSTQAHAYDIYVAHFAMCKTYLHLSPEELLEASGHNTIEAAVLASFKDASKKIDDLFIGHVKMFDGQG